MSWMSEGARPVTPSKYLAQNLYSNTVYSLLATDCGANSGVESIPTQTTGEETLVRERSSTMGNALRKEVVYDTLRLSEVVKFTRMGLNGFPKSKVRLSHLGDRTFRMSLVVGVGDVLSTTESSGRMAALRNAQ